MIHLLNGIHFLGGIYVLNGIHCLNKIFFLTEIQPVNGYSAPFDARPDPCNKAGLVLNIRLAHARLLSSVISIPNS